ncbi:MAG: hypothetical protein ACK2UK_04280 [Candidatus Promineifilaceae bacterium]
MKIGTVTLRPVQIGIIILTVITAIVHFSLGGLLFTLNGLGYLALLAAYFLPVDLLQRYHRWIRWLFAGYLLLTIVLYFVFNSDGSWLTNSLGLFTKAIELILLVLLAVDARQDAAQM